MQAVIDHVLFIMLAPLMSNAQLYTWDEALQEYDKCVIEAITEEPHPHLDDEKLQICLENLTKQLNAAGEGA